MRPPLQIVQHSVFVTPTARKSRGKRASRAMHGPRDCLPICVLFRGRVDKRIVGRIHLTFCLGVHLPSASSQLSPILLRVHQDRRKKHIDLWASVRYDVGSWRPSSVTLRRGRGMGLGELIVGYASAGIPDAPPLAEAVAAGGWYDLGASA